MLNDIPIVPTIITSPFIKRPEVVRRSWTERLFTWPWRPWQSRKVIQVPDEYIYCLQRRHTTYIFCHPVWYSKVYKALTKAGYNPAPPDLKRPAKPTPPPPPKRQT